MSEIDEVLSGARRWALIQGDCREVLPGIPDEGVDHCLTDPPYSRDLYARARTNKGSNVRANGKPYRVQDLPAFPGGAELASLRIGAIDDVLEHVAAEMLRTVKRWLLVFSDMEITHRWRESVGKWYLRTGIWVKPDAMPQITGDRPAQGFEPATIGHRPGRKRWNGGGLPAVWIHGTAKGNERPDHPCPKPLPLMLELVALFTDPGDLVLDPFAGSSTTGVACLRLGRRFLGIERDPTFAALSHERLEAESQGLSLRAARAGQLAMFPDEKKRKAR